MSEGTALWWKGTFPVWIVLLLVSSLAYFYTRGETDNQEFHRQAQSLHLIQAEAKAEMNSRIAVLENAISSSSDRLRRIEDKLDTVISNKKP